MDGDKLASLRDLDGELIIPFIATLEGTYRHANVTETLILYWKQALKIPGTSVSRIALQAEGMTGEGLDSLAKRIIWTTEYNVWTSLNGKVTKYYFGEYVEMGGITIIVPLAIVLLNLSLVMISIVSERQKEIFTLTCVGFNPTHIAALFLAESIVMGLIGGGFGYLLGMGTYRLMILFNVDLAVKQKLEWYWSAIGVLISVGVSILSAVRPALRAAMKATPSTVKRIKLSEKERIKREEEIWKVYDTQEILLPVRIQERDALIFFSYFSSRLHDLRTGFIERIKDYSETDEETPEGALRKHIKFTYVYGDLETINELTARKRPTDGYYTLSLLCKPKVPGIPRTFIERTIHFVRGILAEWEEERPRIIGA